MVPNSVSIIVAIFVQAVLYGLYVATLIHSIRWLVFNDEGWDLRERIEWFILVVTILFFVSSSVDLGATIRIVLGIGNVVQPPLMGQLFVMNNAIETFTLLIADAVLVFRCWVVYSRSWKSIWFPLTLWIGNLGMTTLIITTQTIAALEPSKLPVNWDDSKFYISWIAFHSGNILINVYATVTIIYKLLRVAKDGGNSYSACRLRCICRILAQSGVLYTSTTMLALVSMILNLKSSNKLVLLEAVASGANFSMTGIAFNLIVIEVGRLRAAEHKGQTIVWKHNTRAFLWLGNLHNFRENTPSDVALH